MFLPTSYCCCYCGEEIETSVDPGQASQSRYVEDCQVCCRPNVLTVAVDPVTGTATVYADPESDGS